MKQRIKKLKKLREIVIKFFEKYDKSLAYNQLNTKHKLSTLYGKKSFLFLEASFQYCTTRFKFRV